ncbi:MAG TPA: alpha/beta hydrolase [Actinoplanes sp.]|jgi:pimeloyl-ACP methyl ester carboxylesterase
MPGRPVVFIHGLWIHSSAWAPWLDLFAGQGYQPVAPGWPGDAATVAETRAAADALDDVGIEQICHHYADHIDTLETKPIVVGHSFGGLIAQELLANNLAVAAVAIDPAPIKGVKTLPFSQLRSGFPVLGNPANKKRTVSLTAKQFRYSFGNALTEQESDALFEAWTIPGPGRPLFEDATANFSRNSPAKVQTHQAVRGPLLLISGDKDHTVPKAVTLEVAKMYENSPDSITEYREFAGRGHSLTIDAGWRTIADSTLEWLATQRLDAQYLDAPLPVSDTVA